MATNGANGADSSPASKSEANLIEAPPGKFSKKEKIGGTIKLKRPPPKQTKPGNWQDSEVPGDSKKDNSTAINNAASSPMVNELDDKEVATFATGQPMVDEPDLVVCKHCKKPVIKTVAAAHIQNCLKQKQERLKKKKEAKENAAREKEAKEKAKEESVDAEVKDLGKGKGGEDKEGSDKVKGAKKSANGSSNNGADDGPKKSKKRKADEDAEKAPKTKKKKEEPKPKAPKPKGPVDVERHCGVPLPNGAQCARSLTCKSHSMGAKRAVPGRSLPYDMLLHAYQKKNQAKQQKAAIDANAPLQDDFDHNAGPIDSDEEKDTIMAAIARSRPQPLEQRILVPTRRKYQYIRMKEMLSNALGGSRGAGLFSTGDAARRDAFSNGDVGGGAIFSPVGGATTDVSDQLYGQSRRSSLIQQSVGGHNRQIGGGVGATSRKSSTPAAVAQPT
ncbi:MAG: Mitochondrial beta-keto-acyl synthase [Piccolia ochrophora]|nr:MAG: Mitochondrial beta-keto-acyl synthase [Piccolia ochrophora]